MRRGPSIDKQRGAINPLPVSPLLGYDWTFLVQGSSVSAHERPFRNELRGLYDKCCSSLLTRVSFERWYALCCVYMQLGDGQRRVLPLMAQNLSTKEIANVLGKKKKTVDLYVSDLKTAFGARSREFLVLLLVVSGIFVLPYEGLFEENYFVDKDKTKVSQADFPLLANYDWGQLKYSRLPASEEALLKERLGQVYEDRCTALPLIACHISFENWQSLYRVYMQIGDGKRRVLSLMAQNLTTQEIADRLGRDRGTINTHISEIKAAFGAKSREFLVFLLAVSGIFVFDREGIRDAAA